MAFWEFLDYVTEARACPISDWWAGQDSDVQAAFDLLITTMAATEDWDDLKRPKHKVLTGNHAGICELKFDVKGKGKFRVLGLWRTTERQFVVFGACRKQMKPFVTLPLGAFDEAYELMHRLQEGKGGTRPHV